MSQHHRVYIKMNLINTAKCSLNPILHAWETFKVQGNRELLTVEEDVHPTERNLFLVEADAHPIAVDVPHIAADVVPTKEDLTRMERDADPMENDAVPRKTEMQMDFFIYKSVRHLSYYCSKTTHYISKKS